MSLWAHVRMGHGRRMVHAQCVYKCAPMCSRSASPFSRTAHGTWAALRAGRCARQSPSPRLSALSVVCVWCVRPGGQGTVVCRVRGCTRAGAAAQV
eukprot:scaffold36131_cov87-Phaeocystis_antarctica.AAC.1